jgi:periplasmic divalent cation tolerance protein
MNSEHLVLLSTVPDGPAAEALARSLVAEGLAACVNCVPGVQSTYRWQGAVQESSEVLLVIKSTPAAYASLERRIRELHPYEVPEIVALPIVCGSQPYLAWLAGQITLEGGIGRGPRVSER